MKLPFGSWKEQNSNGTFTVTGNVSGLAGPSALQWYASTDINNLPNVSNGWETGSKTGVGNGPFSFTVPIQDDTADESPQQPESLTVWVNVGGAWGNNSGTLTEESGGTGGPALSGPQSITETGSNQTISFSLTGAPPGNATWTASCTDPADLVATSTSGPVTVGPAGTGTVMVTTQDDNGTGEQSPQTLTVMVDGASAYVTINEDTTDMGGTTPSVSIQNANAVAEGSALSFPVTVSNTTGPVTVNWSVVSTSDSNDAPLGESGTLMFNTAGTQQLPVNTVDDLTAGESNQNQSVTVKVTLGTVSNSASGTITEPDVDYPIVGIKPPTTSVVEGNPLVFPVTVAYSGGVTETVNWKIISETDPRDVPSSQPTQGTMVFQGDGQKTLTINTRDDLATGENSQSVTVQVTLGSTSSASAMGTITEDTDPIVAISDAPAVAEDGNGTLMAYFPVTVSPALSSPVTLTYATQDGTAKAGIDYTSATNAPFIVPAGTSPTNPAYIVVPIKDDNTANETSPETFYVNLLSASSGATVGSPSQGKGTIDDSDPPPTVGINDAQASEQAANGNLLTFTVTLNGATAQPVAVPYTIEPGTATTPEDYTANPLSGIITFSASQSPTQTETITVTANDDPVDDPPQEQSSTENPETAPADANQEAPTNFTVVLSPPANGDATVARGTGTGTIYDGAVPDNQPSYCTCMCSCGNVENEVNQADGTLGANDGGADPNTDLKQIQGDRPHPIVTVDDRLSPNAATATSVTVQWTFNGMAQTPLYYNPAGYQANQTVVFAQQFDAGALPPGRYPWSMTVTENYALGSPSISRTYHGNYNVQNLDASPFGAGWMLQSADQLYPTSGGVELADGSGNMYYFTKNSDGSFTSPLGAPGFSTLTAVSGSGYTLTDENGNVENFNLAGWLGSKVDSNGNTTNFNHNTDGTVSTIVDQEGRITKFVYNAGLVASITDIYGRTTSLGYNSAR